MKILILEDEIPAFEKLLTHIEAFFSEKIQYDWARSNIEGKKFLQAENYDFILSDIQLLDGISFDLFHELKPNAPIIFCSAHDEYLFQAFNTNGIAYILKPYAQKDFNQALEKYQTLFSQGDYNSLDSKTLSKLKSALQEETQQFKKRFVIKHAKGIQLLNVSDISVITASGDFCIATDFNGKRHNISQNLGSIHQELNPQKFFRINRSEIIQMEYISKIQNHFKNRLMISMQGFSEWLMTSSSTTAEFRKWLEE